MADATAAIDTKARILEEAERLFRVYGYSKTTVADIADACGMSPSNVYRFFASKAAINEAICERIIATLESRLFTIVRLPRPASERLKLFIQELHRYTVEMLLDEKKVHDMVTAAIEEQWGTIVAHLDRTTALIAEILKDGMQAGEFRQQDAARAAECVAMAIAALKHPVIVAQCMDRCNQATAEEMAAFVISALKP